MMTAERRLHKTNSIPCRVVQDAFQKAIQSKQRVNIQAIAASLDLRLSVAQELYKHFRACASTSVNTEFAYWGEMTWKRIRYCATCGTPTRNTMGGECRSCWMGPTPVDHWKALELLRTDKESPTTPARQAQHEAMREVDSDVAERLRELNTPCPEERMIDLRDLCTDCFSDDL